MADIDKKTIQHLSHLSRINCDEQAQEFLLKDLKKILDHIEQLKEVDTEGVEPCHHVLQDTANVLREDVVLASMPREEFLANAPSFIGGMIRVPPVLKQG